VSTCPHPQILPWLHIDVQRVKIRSIALTIAFSEQMYQVANTTSESRPKQNGSKLTSN
jgi:hypothetical protein